MILHTDEWLELADGKRYLGAVDNETGQPQGLGIVAIDDMHFYAGDFVMGKRHGRGFIITHGLEVREEPVWIPDSYENVMATAEFDSNGRVVRCDRLGHYEPRMVRHDSWAKSQDGIWADDEFVEPIDIYALHDAPWMWCDTKYTVVEYYDNLPCAFPRVYESQICEASQEGDYSFNGKAFVTVYDDGSLMFCDRYGHVFRLAPEGEYHYDVMRYGRTIKERRIFSLHIAEHDDEYDDDGRFDAWA